MADLRSRLRGSVAKGSLWAVLGYGGGQILRLGGNLVLWRLLDASAFGLMAIVNVLLLGLTMFSDVGIGPSIIQNERGHDPRFLKTAFSVQVLRGFALLAVAAASSVPLARFYGEPLLSALIPVVAVSAALAGFNSTKLFTATKRVALGKLTVVDLASQAAGLAVMVLWAVRSASIWALVAGGLAASAVRLALSHVVLEGPRDGFLLDLPSLRSLLHFGRWIFVSTLLTFAVMQSDRLVFGKLVSMQTLGVYSIATVWASFPTQILGHVFQSVAFPTLSKLHNEGSDVGPTHRSLRMPWLAASGWASACLIAGGPALVGFLYDARAEDAGPVLQILSAGAWLLALEITNGSALLACGKPKWVAGASAAKLAGMIVFIPLGFSLGGFFGAVAGFAISEVLRYAVSAAGAVRAGVRGYRDDMALTGVVVVTSLAGWLARVKFDDVAALAPISIEHPRALAFAEGVVVLAAVTAGWALAIVTSRRRGLLGAATSPPRAYDLSP